MRRCTRKGHVRNKQDRCNTCYLAWSKCWRNANREHVRAKYHEWKRKNPKRHWEIHRNGHLKRHFGITLEQYERMVKQQKGRCKICRKKTKRTLAVDHCHKTKKVRGLLCDFCNRSLGFVDKMGLKKIVRYLNGR